MIVPRHQNRTREVVSLAARSGFKPDLWTDNPLDSTCLIVDVRGVLASLYGLADIAFIGGTLGTLGGHNILEPLAHSVPVITGPSHYHFTDVVKRASKDNICRVFSNVEQGVSSVVELLDLSSFPREAGTTHGSSDLFLTKMKALLGKMEISL